jgi:hypothetical protein
VIVLLLEYQQTLSLEISLFVLAERGYMVGFEDITAEFAPEFIKCQAPG